MSEINFRKIEKNDLNEVLILLNQLKVMDVSTVNLDDAWKNFKNNNSSNSIVGLFNNKIVAYGSLVIENKITGVVAGHIEDIVVDIEVRGKMIGVLLVKELIKIAKANECYRITLFCKDSLVNFYARNGFEVNNIVMKKYL
ncbi:MAG: hypothetical protein CMC51_04435 [Flavobacteriaceae bacterium]|jgi:predicted GNAT family N-acyltransferase|nr:hypothetical protein [Flavobacteriaceae bacterium]|tara:strand:+ start:62958 stop:63380 length:423 start_codon:yes stop_codon:yes gene_type:complete